MELGAGNKAMSGGREIGGEELCDPLKMRVLKGGLRQGWGLRLGYWF